MSKCYSSKYQMNGGRTRDIHKLRTFDLYTMYNDKFICMDKNIVDTNTEKASFLLLWTLL